MTSRINRLPKGLQDFLGNSNFGNNPSDLSAIVSPTLDMSPFYAAETIAVYKGGQKIVSTEGDIDLVDVPPGYVWLVTGVGCSIRLSATARPAAGAEPSLDIGFRVENWPQRSSAGVGAQNLPVAHVISADTLWKSGNTGQNSYFNTFLPNLFPVLSDTDLIFNVGNLTVNAANSEEFRITPHIWYYPLRT